MAAGSAAILSGSHICRTQRCGPSRKLSASTGSSRPVNLPVLFALQPNLYHLCKRTIKVSGFADKGGSVWLQLHSVRRGPSRKLSGFLGSSGRSISPYFLHVLREVDDGLRIIFDFPGHRGIRGEQRCGYVKPSPDAFRLKTQKQLSIKSFTSLSVKKGEHIVFVRTLPLGKTHVPVDPGNRFVDGGADLAVFDHFAKARANIGNGLAQRTKKASFIPLAIFFEPLFVARTAEVF